MDTARAERRDARTVLLDANVLLLPFRSRFPLESELARIRPGARVVVPTSVLRELDRLARRGVPRAASARSYAARFERLATKGSGDDAIVALARRSGATVVTADRALRTRLRMAGVAVAYPRKRNRLALDRRAV